MARQQCWPGRKGWVFALLTSLLLTLSPLPSAWPAGIELGVDGPRQGGPAKQVRVTIQRGLLSVDLREAEVGEVLAQIGQKASIPITYHPTSGKRISAQLTGIELEQGLRHLLRLAAVSYTILYAEGPTGRFAIQEVRVFGEEQGESPWRPIVAERRAEEDAADAGERFTQVLIPPRSALPPAEGLGSESINRIVEALERGREQGSPILQGGDSAAVRRIHEVIERALHDSAEAPPPPAAE